MQGEQNDPPKGNRHVLYGYDEENNLFFASPPNSSLRVYVSHRERLRLYRHGFRRRRRKLLSDYCLNADLLNQGDLVVDVGANIGEFGLWARDVGANYVGFEPDPLAHRAMRLNVPDGKLFELGLSDTNGSASFFLDTANADSSLFQSEGHGEELTIQIARLDDVDLGELAGRAIKLLKVEAEGMEPEVLAGAKATLDRCEFVAVDAGPERGGENTVPQVMNALTDAGFKVVDCFLRRGTFLFKRR